MSREMVTLSTAFHAIVFTIVTFGIPDFFSSPDVSATIIPVELVEIAEETKITTKRPPPVPKARPEATPAKPDAVPPPPSADTPKPTDVPPIERLTAKALPREKPNVQKKPNFDLNQIAALLDKKRPDAQPDELPPTDRALAVQTATRSLTDAARFTLSERDALKAQLYACWNVPVGALDAESLVVEIQVSLNRDGSLARAPKLSAASTRRMDEPFFRVAAESALRAVRKCEPLKLPPEKYQEWRELLLRFDPGEMLS